MNDLTVFYRKPSTKMNRRDTWQEETLPIGNGIIGATVWGEIQCEKLTLNEETAESSAEVKAAPKAE